MDATQTATLTSLIVELENAGADVAAIKDIPAITDPKVMKRYKKAVKTFDDSKPRYAIMEFLNKFSTDSATGGDTAVTGTPEMKLETSGIVSKCKGYNVGGYDVIDGYVQCSGITITHGPHGCMARRCPVSLDLEDAVQVDDKSWVTELETFVMNDPEVDNKVAIDNALDQFNSGEEKYYMCERHDTDVPWKLFYLLFTTGTNPPVTTLDQSIKAVSVNMTDKDIARIEQLVDALQISNDATVDWVIHNVKKNAPNDATRIERKVRQTTTESGPSGLQARRSKRIAETQLDRAQKRNKLSNTQ